MRLNGPMVRLEEPYPLGDVTLAPPAATGRSELETARAMTGARNGRARTAGAEHRQPGLSQTMPRGRLSARLRAVAALMRQEGRPRW